MNLDKIDKIEDVPNIITDDSYPLTVTVDTYEVTIKSDGSVIEGRWSFEETEAAETFETPGTIDGGVASATNPMIPAGFKPINTEKAKWKDENGNIVVAENVNNGMVIADEEGNQYVWIPVDGILGQDGKTVQNAVSGEVILGRYVFNNDGTINEELTTAALESGELKTSSASGVKYTEDSEKVNRIYQ